MAKKKKKSTAATVLLDVMIVILIGVIGFSGWKLYEIYSRYHHNTVSQSRLQEVFYAQTTDAVVGSVEGSEVSQTQLSENALSGATSLGLLVAKNEDTVGWIKVDGTVIDNAVMWCGNNDYYLHRDFFGDYNYAGIPFLDGSNILGSAAPTPWQNYIIYGHRMKDKSMFHILGEYTERDFYEAHKTFSLLLRIDDQDILFDAEVFSAYRLTTRDEYYWTTMFETEEEYQEYLDRIMAKTAIDTGVTVTTEDMIVTLSTCDSTLDATEGRLLVHARLIPRVYTPVDPTVGQ